MRFPCLSSCSKMRVSETAEVEWQELVTTYPDTTIGSCLFFFFFQWSDTTTAACWS